MSVARWPRQRSPSTKPPPKNTNGGRTNENLAVVGRSSIIVEAMTTIVLAHPNQHCPRFQVFGVYDGPDDRFTFAAQESDNREKAERVAHKLMEDLEADHFRRVIRPES